MEKRAAMNKLAQAVTNYIQAEQQYTKVATAAQKYAMEKKAGLAEMLGMAKKPAAPAGMSGMDKRLLAILAGSGLGSAAYAGGLDAEALKGLGNKAIDSAAQIGMPKAPELGSGPTDNVYIQELAKMLTNR